MIAGWRRSLHWLTNTSLLTEAERLCVPVSVSGAGLVLKLFSSFDVVELVAADVGEQQLLLVRDALPAIPTPPAQNTSSSQTMATQ